MNNPAANGVGSCPFLPDAARFRGRFPAPTTGSGEQTAQFFLPVRLFPRADRFTGRLSSRPRAGRFTARLRALAPGSFRGVPPPFPCPAAFSFRRAGPRPRSAGFRPAFRFGRAAAEGAGLFAALLPFLNKINKETGAAPARVCACPAHDVLIQKYRPRIHCARSAKFYPGFAVAVTILIRGRPDPRSR